MIQEQNSTHENIEQYAKKFLVLYVMGFFIIFIGVIVLIAATLLSGNGTVNLGGFILIGPIPIVIGVGPEASFMVLLAIVLGILSMIMFLVLRRKTKESKV